MKTYLNHLLEFHEPYKLRALLKTRAPLAAFNTILLKFRE